MAVLFILVGLWVWTSFFNAAERSDTVRVSGNIEVTDVQLGFKISGRVEQCLVDEGDSVVTGQLLARLERVDQRIAVDLARAMLAQAKSVLSELEAGSRPQEITLARARVQSAEQTVLELTRGNRVQEIESAKSDLETALAAVKTTQAQLAQAKADFDRFSVLYTQKGTSRQEFRFHK